MNDMSNSMLTRIRYAVDRFWHEHGRDLKNAKEPAYSELIASMLPSYLKDALEDSHIEATGAYIHQRPYVWFKNSAGRMRKCELGDVMVVVQDCRDGDDRINVSLLQLKRERGRIKSRLKENELNQLELYAKWPELSFPGKGTRPSYDIYPKTPTPGAQYLFVSEATSSDWHVAAPILPFDLSAIDFARHLDLVMNFASGRSITGYDDAEKDAWSKLIWSVLLYLDGKHYKSNLDRLPIPRMSDVLSSLICKNMRSQCANIGSSGMGLISIRIES